jgi:hypothetical protein
MPLPDWFWDSPPEADPPLPLPLPKVGPRDWQNSLDLLNEAKAKAKATGKPQIIRLPSTEVPLDALPEQSSPSLKNITAADLQAAYDAVDAALTRPVHDEVMIKPFDPAPLVADYSIADAATTWALNDLAISMGVPSDLLKEGPPHGLIG